MKKMLNQAKRFFCAATLLLISLLSVAQTPMDTIKPGKSNDPMVVNPGKGNDPMVVKPQSANDPMSVISDTAFISKNITDNIVEIELSKTGLSKGTLPEVRKVASKMIEDHTAILSTLKKLAVKKQLGFKENRMKAMVMPPMDMKKGEAFDKAWSSEMLAMHEAKIAELESFTGTTRDAELKAAALQALQKIKVHKDMLSKIAATKAQSSTSPTI